MCVCGGGLPKKLVRRHEAEAVVDSNPLLYVAAPPTAHGHDLEQQRQVHLQHHPSIRTPCESEVHGDGGDVLVVVVRVRGMAVMVVTTACVGAVVKVRVRCMVVTCGDVLVVVRVRCMVVMVVTCWW